MKYSKKNKRSGNPTNAIDGASTSPCWGKKAKRYPGCAGKGGKTTNFDPELKKEEVQKLICGGKENA